MESIRTAIKGLLDGVVGIGQVWDHRRILDDRPLTDDPTQFDSLFVKNGKVNCWQLWNTAINEDAGGLGGLEDRTFTWTIEGWYEFTDSATLATSSEYAFDALVEAICAAIRGSYRIGGATNENGPATSISKDVVMQGSVRCHHVVMFLTVQKVGL